MILLPLAVAPVFIFLFYIYIRDKYEKEPIRLLVIGTTFGAVIAFPIVFAGNYALLLLPIDATMLQDAAFNAFVVAAFIEEFFKYIVLFFLIWRNPNLNEPFDGIVYAVFISLGFAFVENILYVFSEDVGGLTTALVRAVISVPGHGLFGVIMGYYFTCAFYAKAKNQRTMYLALALVAPVVMHGIYNFLLLTNVYKVVFLGFFALLWHISLKKMKSHIEISPFIS